MICIVIFCNKKGPLECQAGLRYFYVYRLFLKIHISIIDQNAQHNSCYCATKIYGYMNHESSFFLFWRCKYSYFFWKQTNVWWFFM